LLDDDDDDGTAGGMGSVMMPVSVGEQRGLGAESKEVNESRQELDDDEEWGW
jgi:hypothetical protein